MRWIANELQGAIYRTVLSRISLLQKSELILLAETEKCKSQSTSIFLLVSLYISILLLYSLLYQNIQRLNVGFSVPLGITTVRNFKHY